MRVSYGEPAGVVRMSDEAAPSCEVQRAACPRCGYDQRGVIATWSESCPIRGVCSECGLAFEWNQLLSRRLQRPPWCVEYSSRSAFHRAIANTLLRSLWPPRFWSALKLWHEPRWRRLLVYLGLLLIAGYVVFASGHGFLAWKQRNWIAARGGTALPSTMAVLAQAMATPLSDQSLGMISFTGPAGTGWTLPPQPFPSPWSLFALYPGLDGYGLPAAMTATMFAILPLSFVALPISMRRAKVRWAHVGRITLYALGPIILTLIALLIALVFMDRVLPCVIMPGIAIWLLLWWWMAVARYLRMEHAWAVFGSIAVIAGLCTWLVHDFILFWQFL
jgi:hypothetical protein